jgi:hypothetical protein
MFSEALSACSSQRDILIELSRYQQHSEGDNVVVAHDVERAFSRSYGNPGRGSRACPPFTLEPSLQRACPNGGCKQTGNRPGIRW